MHMWLCFLAPLLLCKEEKIQHPLPFPEPRNLWALVLQSITTYCRGALCSQVSVCPQLSISLSLPRCASPVPPLVVSACLSLASSLPSAHSPLQSRVIFSLAFHSFFAPAVEVIQFPLLIFSIAFFLGGGAAIEKHRKNCSPLFYALHGMTGVLE